MSGVSILMGKHEKQEQEDTVLRNAKRNRRREVREREEYLDGLFGLTAVNEEEFGVARVQLIGGKHVRGQDEGASGYNGEES